MSNNQKDYWKLDDTSLEVVRLKLHMSLMVKENKAILKDHRRLDKENQVLRARIARLELLAKKHSARSAYSWLRI